MDSLKVNCYSGHTYAERPQSFEWKGIKYEVAVIEKDWQEPAGKCFQVRTVDNGFFKLCCNGIEKQWAVIELGRGEKDERNS